MEPKEKKILIVDDQINLLTTLKFIFEERNFDVTMVSSGEEALEKISKEKYNLALVDMNMPGMDGLETFRAIKRKSPTTIVIIMTGNKNNLQIKNCLEEGAVAVIYKPFAISKLVETISNSLTKPVVLVVDDRSEERAILRNSLELKDYRVVEAEDGTGAIEKIKKGKFDICLVDYKMPGLNGLETIDRIKEINPNIGVIMMSGFTIEEAIRQEIKNRNEFVFIEKPYDIENLVNLIEEELDKIKK